MTEINRAGELGSLGEVNTTQREFRQQIDALNDIVRQLGGNPDVNPGGTFPSDPLSAPYVLYVDAYTGSDTFVSGDYNTKDDGTFDDKVRRISLQRLECGYTINRPFRTINRAIIEAAIITSRDYLNLSPGPCGDLVSIVVAAGVHEIINAPGRDLTDVEEWEDGQVPTDEELLSFNPRATGGLILPRGCSVVSLDLRKTILRPQFVPTPEPEEPDYSNRRAIFKVTGGGYYFGFTFLDKLGFNQSHHLLDAFQYASKDELDTLYEKILKCFGPEATGLTSVANTRTRLSEYQITGQVGDQPVNFTEPTGGTDTVRSASPYIYNTSLRSTYGMCGIFADGDKVDGFKSMVVAQFTGVSLQNDYSTWQKYSTGSGGNWVPVTSFTDYTDRDPDNLRLDPQQRSFHIRAVNEALIQEVSVFAIGQAIHHWAQSGAQLTITNSNSNFGGCSALAEGFQKKAAQTDGPWTIKFFRTALSPLAKQGNVNRIILGTIKDGVANDSKSIQITSNLAESTSVPDQPDALVRDNYSLKENDYLWIENPGGPDYRARLAADPWDPSASDFLQVKDVFRTDNLAKNVQPGDPGEDPDLNSFPNIAGKRIYVRRLVDTRTVEERRFSILLKSQNPGSVLRLPIRDYVIADPGVENGYGDLVQAVAASENMMNDPDVDVKVELRYSNKPSGPVDERTYNEASFYRKGDVVLRNKKHFTAIRNTTGPFKSEDFSESYVHMQEDFIPEGFFGNAQPNLIFDNDTDEAESSALLGNTIAVVQQQLETAVDYLGLKYFLRNLRVNPTDVLEFADTEDDRNQDADVILGGSTDTEFRRPTNCRLFGQAYEWAGYGNYSKALPQYQGELSAQNKFTYYFTNEDGGKVFATGFNEEGLQVTPRGLEDITTGEVLSVTDIGNPDRDISIPTQFQDLEVTNSLKLSFIQNGLITGPANTGIDNAPPFGPTRLAAIDKTNSQDVAGTDDDINEDGANVGVITPKWLNKWRIDNNILSAPSTQVFVYVNPIDGMDMSIDQLSSTPPSRPNRAVKTLKRAVDYANTIYGPEAVVVYKLGPGPYFEKEPSNDTITFKTVARLEAYDFDKFKPLNNSTGGGTVPFLQVVTNPPQDPPVNDLSQFDNPFKQPTFLTRTTVVTIATTNITTIKNRPLTLIFEQDANVSGIAWYGTSQSLKAWAFDQLGNNAEQRAAADDFFADFYKGQVDNPEQFAQELKGLLRSGTSASDDSEALNITISKCFAGLTGLPGSKSLSRSGGGNPVAFRKAGVVANCAFGAFVAIPEGEGSTGSRGVIRTQGDPLLVKGLYLYGNVKLSSGPNTTYQFQGSGTDAFELRGFHESLIFTDERNRPEDSVNIRFGGNDRGNDKNFNLVWNNIHLINNDRTPGVADDINTAFSQRGPVLGCLINNPGQLVLPTGIWTSSQATVDGQFQGFVGRFGLIRSSDGTITNRTRGLFGYGNGNGALEPPPGFKIVVSKAADQLTSFWRVAGSGDLPTLPAFSGLPGEVQANADEFSPLGLAISGFKKGIDINGNVSIAQDLRL